MHMAHCGGDVSPGAAAHSPAPLREQRNHAEQQQSAADRLYGFLKSVCCYVPPCCGFSLSLFCLRQKKADRRSYVNHGRNVWHTSR